MRVALLLAAVLLISACQSKVVPVSARLEKETVTSEFLMQSLIRRQADIKTLKSFVQTTVEKADFKQVLQQTIILCNGDSIRVDTFSPFGQALWVFMHNTRDAMLYDMDKNRIYHGADVEKIMQQVTGSMVNFKEVIHVFSGNIPRLDRHKVNRAYLEQEKDRYRLETVDESGHERYEITMDAEGLYPTKWVRFLNDSEVYAVTWDNYKLVENRPFPHHIHIGTLAGREKLEIYYRSPKINMELTQKAFELPGPGQVRLECRSMPGAAEKAGLAQ